MRTTPEVRFWRQAAQLASGRESRLSYEGDHPTDLTQLGERVQLLEWLAYWKGIRDVNVPAATLEKAQERRSEASIREGIFFSIKDRLDPLVRDRRAAWLKGAVELERDTYPQGVRRMADLDLLIPWTEREQWHEILTARGFTSYRDPGWVQSDSFPHVVSTTLYQAQIEGVQVMLDLHWHLVDFPARRICGRWDFQMEPIWQAAGQTAMSPEHRLLYLSDHAFTHGYRPWKSLLDIRMLLQQDDLDETYLSEEAERTGFGMALQLTVSLMERMGWEKEIVPDYTDSVFPRRLERFLDQASRAETSPEDYLVHCFFALETTYQRLEFLRGLILPPMACLSGLPEPPGLAGRLQAYTGRLQDQLQAGAQILAGD